jgi:hypothetical protein
MLVIGEIAQTRDSEIAQLHVGGQPLAHQRGDGCDRSTWPPCAAVMIREARFRTRPK